MRKRQLLVALVSLVGIAVSYGVVLMTAAVPTTVAAEEAVESSADTLPVMATAPAMSPSMLSTFGGLFDAMPDAVMLFAAGMALFGLAEGVRRHTW